MAIKAHKDQGALKAHKVLRVLKVHKVLRALKVHKVLSENKDHKDLLASKVHKALREMTVRVIKDHKAQLAVAEAPGRRVREAPAHVFAAAVADDDAYVHVFHLKI